MSTIAVATRNHGVCFALGTRLHPYATAWCKQYVNLIVSGDGSQVPVCIRASIVGDELLLTMVGTFGVVFFFFLKPNSKTSLSVNGNY